MVIEYLLKLKKRLQFTGWLQYIPTLVLSIICGIIALVFRFFGVMSVYLVFLILSGLLFTAFLFDMITVKINIRPKEKLPERNDTMDIFDLMRSRRSCRSFQPRKLEPDHLKELLDYVQKQSTLDVEHSIGKKRVRFEYIAATLTVWPVVGAQEFLVAIAPKEYNRKSIIDVGRNLQKIVLYATKMGLATCWIGPGADQSSVTHHMGNRFHAEEDHVICVCAIGYKSWFKPLVLRVIQQIQRRRLPLSSLFYLDSDFSIPLNVKKYPFNLFSRTYEVCQWSPSSFNAQTTQCIAVTQEDAKSNETLLKRFDFYAKTSSRYYAPVALGIWCANWETGAESLGIKGHFRVLSDEERGKKGSAAETELPIYDVSWVLDETIECVKNDQK